VVLWLDLANAYGSIPHKLVEEALNRHHIPGKFRDLILDDYNSFSTILQNGISLRWDSSLNVPFQ